MERTCPGCNETFITNKTNKKYCSEKCRTSFDRFHRRKLLDYQKISNHWHFRSCWSCGTKFFTDDFRNRYCSEKCRENGPSERGESRKCQYCGTEFVLNDIKRICCSNKCQNLACVEKRAKGKKVTHSGEKRHCAYCGVEFIVTGRGQKYCSSECGWRKRYGEYCEKLKNQPGDQTCFYCGISFTPRTQKQRYCSIECFYQWKRDQRKHEYGLQCVTNNNKGISEGG